MVDASEPVAASIARAREHLEHALVELEKRPALDASAIAFGAHALNNYLTLTGGTIELLLEALAPHPDRQIHAWLDALQHTTTLMTHTVSQLMSAAMARSAAQPIAALRFEQLQLPVMAQRLCHYYERAAARKDLRILFSVSDAVPPVWTDRVATGAILDNLLSNAVKFSPPGRRIWVHVRGDGPSVLCSVTDEGPGLSPEDQTHLYQRGVRLTPAPTGGEPSTGYGLAVAKELAEQVGGSVSYISTQGPGACFALRLPACQEPDA
jgi:signal transduction histidine kinase